MPKARSEMKKQFDGDSHFCYNMTILIGSSAEVTTRDGKRFEGIFVAFSAKQEVMLEAAHLVEEADETIIIKHFDALVIPSDKVLAVRFEDVDLSYATRDFQLDGAIAGNRVFVHGDKELTPWDGSDSEHFQDLYLDGDGNQNGWEAQEMFKKNEENFGVISTYNQDLAGYTIQLDKSDPDSFKKHEEHATQVALEIEKNSSSLDRSKLENGDDEEEAFSAVVRPRHITNHVTNTTAANTATCSGNDKYVPPSRRQNQPTQSGIQSVVNLNQTATNGPSHINHSNSNTGGSRKPIYGPNIRSNFGSNSTSNSLYQHDRRHFDSRRPAPTNQYGSSSVNHTDGRRAEESRLARVGTKPIKASVKLTRSNDFKSTTVASANEPETLQANSTGAAVKLIPSNDFKSLTATPGVESEVLLANVKNASVKLIQSNDFKSKTGTTTIESEDQPPNEEDTDSDAKRKFTFNPNAKEFNPAAKSFTPRSPSTPPRPPSTSSAPVNSYVPMPALLYNPPYGPASLAQSPNPSISSGSNQRSVLHNRKGAGLVGLPDRRADITQQMQVQGAGPPLLAPASLQASHSQYTIIPSAYSQVRIHPQNMVSMYSEGSGGAQMHLPMHYFPHNGASNQTNSTHQPGSTQPNQSGPSSIVSTNTHGFAHGHYPFVGLPVVGVPYQHNHPHPQMITSPYLPHQGTI